MKYLIVFLTGLLFTNALAQNTSLQGVVSADGEGIPYANVYLKSTKNGTATNENGNYTISNLAPGKYVLITSAIGYETKKTSFSIADNEVLTLNIALTASAEALDEMVVTGTLKAVSRLESAVPVEVYSPTFLKKNPTPSIFEALQNVNGVRPQINCNVCNTGDIHINGLEGPYTLVLIDGMPIVSGLGTVYGLSGIPNSLIDQIEIVKGPKATSFGANLGGAILLNPKKAIGRSTNLSNNFTLGSTYFWCSH